ncbi:MAG: GGDEF domain-containing protein [Devosia sp.]|nr:GGDEF domain-containing protein [Devosia sp.]
MFERIDFSARGRARVVLWTIFGTIGCIVVALLFDSFDPAAPDSAQRLHMTIADIVLPIVLAAPLLYFFSNKLRELAIAHYQLAIYASTDSLTSVLNRGAFTTLVDAYLSQVREQERGVNGALLVIDVDHFKRINDNFGHDRGDEALRLIAQTIKGALRSVDLVGRIGGEEFGVFLPGAPPDRAEVAAERIRTAIAEAKFVPDGIKLSVSVGGATFDRGVPFRTLYRAADKQLYEAKETGRNRVAFSSIDEAPSQAAA